MKTYYSDAQFKHKILKTFIHAAGFKECKFREQLERVAWLFVNGKAEEDPLSKPSEQIRHFESMGRKARRLKAVLSDARSNIYLAVHLREAAQTLARRDRVPLPYFKEPELIVYNHPIEPLAKFRPQVERQLQATQRSVEWLCHVIDEAERQIRSELPKGRQPAG